MRAVSVYADTSVFGGVADQEFATVSQAFFQEVRLGRFSLVISALVGSELRDAPEPVRAVLDDMLPWTTVALISDEALDLQQAYLSAGILTPRWGDDALHVAMATVANCSLIVSWNFRHIVHYQKIPQYNAVNASHGYRPLAIYSPQEVLHYEDEEGL